MNIIRIETTDSTNLFLKDFVKYKNPEEGTTIQAYSQIAGRGQAGTSWESEPGKNITCSILFYPSFLPVKQHFLLSKVVALGVKETLDKYTGNVSIKWPNDIYVKDKKITGILIENELSGDVITQSIAGIGVNINQEMFLSNAPNPVSLKQITGEVTDLTIFLEEIISRILFWYQQLKDEEYHLISEHYYKALYHIPGYYWYKDKKEQFKAKIQSVEDNGLLHLKTDEGEERTYFFKEVSFVI